MKPWIRGTEPKPLLMLDLIMRGWSDGAVMATMDEEHVDDKVYRRGYEAGRHSREAFQDTVLVSLCEEGLQIKVDDDFDLLEDTRYNEDAFVASSEGAISELVDYVEAEIKAESSEGAISELVDATEGRR